MNTTRYFSSELDCHVLIDRFMELGDIQRLVEETGHPKKELGKLFKANSVYGKLPHSSNQLYDIDYTAFLDIKQEGSYWLGFLLADGSLCGRTNRIHLELKKEDYPHLIKFRNFLKSTHPIKKHEKTNSCYITIVNKDLHERLTNYGIIPNKTYDFSGMMISIKYKSHFLRGYLDGDGCWGLYKAYSEYKTARFLFSTKTDSTRDYILSLIPEGYIVRTYYHAKHDKWNMTLSGVVAWRFLKWIYYHSTKKTRLDRKYKRYCIINNHYSSSTTGKRG